MALEFRGKTVLVTGSGHGVGKEVSLRFAESGANVVITDLQRGYLGELENKFMHDKVNYLAVEGDVSSSGDVAEMVEKSCHEFGKIDILINNAGVSMTKNMMDLTETDWDSVFNVNVKGTFFMLQTVVKKMVQTGNSGCIINLASIAGQKGRPLFLAYSASKAAVISITKSTALEMAKYNIRVNAVAPGTVDTPMWQDIAGEMSRITGSDVSEIEKTWVEKIPLKRLAKPRDIASLILYLCSDKASYITGQIINICGGLSVL
jgi:NAD(P)-dependent dehydrogenase (short-subunit alcohol dehydrogenase family)